MDIKKKPEAKTTSDISLGKRLRNLEQRFASFEKKIVTKQDHAELVSRVERIEQTIIQLVKKATETEQALSQMVKKVIDTDNRITVMNDAMATKDMLEPMARTLDKVLAIVERLDQERVVTTERLRRVEQEVTKHTEEIDVIKTKLEAR